MALRCDMPKLMDPFATLSIKTCIRLRESGRNLALGRWLKAFQSDVKGRDGISLRYEDRSGDEEALSVVSLGETVAIRTAKARRCGSTHHIPVMPPRDLGYIRGQGRINAKSGSIVENVTRCCFS